MVTRKSTPSYSSVTPSINFSENTKELEDRIVKLETKLDTLISVLKKNPKNGIKEISNGTL
jgi:hypothetical protein